MNTSYSSSKSSGVRLRRIPAVISPSVFSARAYSAAGWPRRWWECNFPCAAGAVARNPSRVCTVLINLLPNTPHTAGTLNHQLFTFLSHNAYLINLGRGSHLVEGDLLRALDSGQIAAAQLDVFVEEPLPAMHPFWSHPRVSITPHVAADTLPEEAMDSIVRNIQAMEAGREPAGRVDLERGY